MRMNVEESSHVVIQSSSPAYAFGGGAGGGGGGVAKIAKTPVRIAGVLAEIQIEHLPHTSQTCYNLHKNTEY